MYPIFKWKWRVADPRKPGRTYVARHYMTEAEALAIDPKAVKIGEPMVIEGPGAAHSTPANR